MTMMSKKAVLSFFTNVKHLDQKMKSTLIAYFSDFKSDTKFRVEVKESTIYITSLAGEILAFVNVPSK